MWNPALPSITAALGAAIVSVLMWRWPHRVREPESPKAATPPVAAAPPRVVTPIRIAIAKPIQSREEPDWDGLALLLRDPTPREEMYEILAQIGVVETHGPPMGRP